MRVYTAAEIRALFLQRIKESVTYWQDLDISPFHGVDDRRHRLNGLAFSILAMLDGSASNLPQFIVAPMPHPDDLAFDQSNKRNWFPFNDPTAIEGNISGDLHAAYGKLPAKSEFRRGQVWADRMADDSPLRVFMLTDVAWLAPIDPKGPMREYVWGVVSDGSHFSDRKRPPPHFPILGEPGKRWVPWELVAEHEGQCQRNHSQTPTRLAERGGLSMSELLCVLENRRPPFAEERSAEVRVQKIVHEWLLRKQGA